MINKMVLFLYCISILSGQSLFNRWVGTDPFTGSARSTAMGNTHLLNSTGSSNLRFNPGKLGLIQSKRIIDFQLNQSSVFERWSMPVRDSFGEFLTNADYAVNEFNYYGVHLGLIGSADLLGIGKAGIGFSYTPLTHFIYQYSEEVRGSYSIDDGEYASKDPIVGYQNLKTDGSPMVSSFGGGVKLGFIMDIDFSIGGAFNIVKSTIITDEVSVDTLYSDVTNLSTLPDINTETSMPSTNFFNFSTTMEFSSNVYIGVSWEDKMKSSTSLYSWSIDSTNGLLQYFKDSTYVTQGIYYFKPEIISMAISFPSDLVNMISIDFEFNQIKYNNHLNLKDYNQFKFGFEYLTLAGTPIRGGLMYRQAAVPALKPASIFTFGTGKPLGNLMIDFAGSYCLQSFSYSDLFPVEGDIRPDYDLVRDSQFNLQLGLTYQF